MGLDHSKNLELRCRRTPLLKRALTARPVARGYSGWVATDYIAFGELLFGSTRRSTRGVNLQSVSSYPTSCFAVRSFSSECFTEGEYRLVEIPSSKSSSSGGSITTCTLLVVVLLEYFESLRYKAFGDESFVHHSWTQLPSSHITFALSPGTVLTFCASIQPQSVKVLVVAISGVITDIILGALQLKIP